MKKKFVDDRFEISEVEVESENFKKKVMEGLVKNPPSLPPRFFYDDRGSRLFQQICELPEYYIPEAEREILKKFSKDILAHAGDPKQIVELGSGDAVKTEILLEQAMGLSGEISYAPIDISRQTLVDSSHRLLKKFKKLSVQAFSGPFLRAFEQVPNLEEGRLILFLGSNIGNFNPEQAKDFFEKIQAHLTERDCLLVGFDRVKNPKIIEKAYNDSKGMTAEFNKNLLRRINREMKADFNLELFQHHAPYLPEMQKIEMRLISKEDQEVKIGALDETYQFQENQYIHTENSHKFHIEDLEKLAATAEFEVVKNWSDSREYFSSVLLK